MTKVLITEDYLTNIGNSIRKENQTTTKYKPSEMANAIETNNANVATRASAETEILNTQTSKLSSVLTALEGKASGGSASIETCTVKLDSKYDDLLFFAAIVATTYNGSTGEIEPYIINDKTKDVTINNVVCGSLIYFINVNNILSWKTGPINAWYCYDGVEYVLIDSTNLNAVFKAPVDNGTTGTIRFTVA